MISSNVALAFLSLAISIIRTDAVKAYMSYQDASCMSSTKIKGDIILSYDDSAYSAYGLTYVNYGGACMYYKGGYLDLDSDFDDENKAAASSSIRDATAEGYCVECDGDVGCSSDGTCDNFMTYHAPTQGGGYQMTGESSRAELFAAIMWQSLNRSERSREGKSVGTYYALGGAVAFVALTGLVAAGELLRRRREERDGRKSLSEKLQESADDEARAHGGVAV